MRSVLKATALVATFAVTGTPVAAQVIVDVASAGAASAGPGLILLGPLGNQRTVANDFVLASSSTVMAASFFTQETAGSLWSGDIFYSFFNPSGGRPGSAPFAQGTATDYVATEVFTSAPGGVVRRIDFNFATPLVLGPGTYFFALAVNQDPGAGRLSWRSVQGSGLSASTAGQDYSSWGLSTGEAAFLLYGSEFDMMTSTAPEPVTMILLGSGLIGIAGAARRRRSVPL